MAMAFVPDEAVYSSSDVSYSAFRLYCVFCAHRNHKSGLVYRLLNSTLHRESGIAVKYLAVVKGELVSRRWIEILPSGETRLLKGDFSVVNRRSRNSGASHPENLDTHPENLDTHPENLDTHPENLDCDNIECFNQPFNQTYDQLINQVDDPNPVSSSEPDVNSAVFQIIHWLNVNAPWLPSSAGFCYDLVRRERDPSRIEAYERFILKALLDLGKPSSEPAEFSFWQSRLNFALADYRKTGLEILPSDATYGDSKNGKNQKNIEQRSRDDAANFVGSLEYYSKRF